MGLEITTLSSKGSYTLNCDLKHHQWKGGNYLKIRQSVNCQNTGLEVIIMKFFVLREVISSDLPFT